MILYDAKGERYSAIKTKPPKMSGAWGEETKTVDGERIDFSWESMRGIYMYFKYQDNWFKIPMMAPKRISSIVDIPDPMRVRDFFTSKRSIEVNEIRTIVRSFINESMSIGKNGEVIETDAVNTRDEMGQSLGDLWAIQSELLQASMIARDEVLSQSNVDRAMGDTTKLFLDIASEMIEMILKNNGFVTGFYPHDLGQGAGTANYAVAFLDNEDAYVVIPAFEDGGEVSFYPLYDIMD